MSTSSAPESTPPAIYPAQGAFRYSHRISGLRGLLHQNTAGEEAPSNEVDAVLVSYLENARYLSGFSGSNGLILVTDTDAFFFTDGRYLLQTATETPGFERVIMLQGTNPAEVVAETALKAGARRVGFESAHTTVAGFDALQKAFGEKAAGVELVGRSNLVESLRMIKDADEIAAMRRACALIDQGYDWLRENARVGMTELELAWGLEMYLRGTLGSPRLGFDSIIGTGPNSALIHGRPGSTRIGATGGPEFLLCDFGCEADGYYSDITRTFVIGGQPTARHREIADAVTRAQQAALDAIRPGASGKDIDSIARQVLTDAGLGEAFGHGLGHGLGRVVHDHPAFSQRAEITLEAGMVVTVEPGAYVEGFGGFRLEDDVLVTETGCERLTHSTRELVIL